MRGMLNDLPVIHETLATAFTSEAGFLVAAERRRWIELVEGVRPDNAGLEQRAHLENPRSLVGPHAGRKSVHGVVRLLDCFLERTECQHAKHGSEDLLPRDSMALSHAGENGRLVVVAPRRQLTSRRLIDLRTRGH